MWFVYGSQIFCEFCEFTYFVNMVHRYVYGSQTMVHKYFIMFT